MPFVIKSVAAPALTRIDLSQATEDDRVTLEFRNGQKLVLQTCPPHPSLICDLALTDRALLTELCSAVLASRHVMPRRFWVSPPTFEEMLAEISITLNPYAVTVGRTISVQIQYSGRTTCLPVAGGSRIKAIALS